MRFKKGNVYATYLGMASGEHSSAANVNRLGITKEGNRHLRLLLTAENECLKDLQI